MKYHLHLFNGDEASYYVSTETLSELLIELENKKNWFLSEKTKYKSKIKIHINSYCGKSLCILNFKKFKIKPKHIDNIIFMIKTFKEQN